MNMKRNWNQVKLKNVRQNCKFFQRILQNPQISNLIFLSFLAEAETVTARNDLKLALKRVEDLQQAINGELDSELDSLAR